LLPEAPGSGVELVADAEKKFPFTRRTINTRLHIDGSVVEQQPMEALRIPFEGALPPQKEFGL
jgi:hypothetical protein